MEDLSLSAMIDLHNDVYKYSCSDFFKNVLNFELFPKQKEIVDNFYDGKISYNELLLVLGKKSGKSLMGAGICNYEIYKLILKKDPQRYYGILPGQAIYALNTCAGKGQAVGIFLDYARNMILNSPFMKRFLVDDLKDELRFMNNIILRSQSSSSRSSLGFACIIVCFDELAWFMDTEGNFSGRAVYESLGPNIKPFGKDGRKVVFSSPGAKSGVFYDIVQLVNTKKIEKTLVYQLPTWEVNPRFTEEDFAEDFARDPEKARMDFGAQFVDQIEAALNRKKIDECTTGKILDINTKDMEVDRIITLDPGIKKDSYALAMGHKKGKKIIIDYVTTWEGTHEMPVQIHEVENFVKNLCKRFRVSKIALDQRFSQSTIQRLSKEGYNIFETPFSQGYNQKIYQALKEHINMNMIVLPQHARLVNELKFLRRYGAGFNISYRAPTTGTIKTDDIADAVANLTYMLSMEDEGCDDFAIDDTESEKIPVSKEEIKKQEDEFFLGGE